MGKILKNLVLSAVLGILYVYPVYGQLNITGEIRPRSELRNGFKTLSEKGDSPAFFTEQRSRINVFYQKEELEFYISAQDVRIWGNTGQIYKTDPALTNLYEAWAAYQFSPRLTLKIGRQALDYDNARFLGDLDWAQQGRSHDALLLTYEDTLGTKVHLGTGFNQNIPSEPGKMAGTVYEGLDNYKTMQFLWYHKKWTKSFASFLFFNDGRQQIAVQPDTEPRVNFRQTYGWIGQKQFTKLILDGEVYHQRGTGQDGRRVSAWLLSATATIKTPLTPISLGMDYLSGAGRGSEINTAFNPLYGTNHKFYGLMDYFYVGNNHGQGNNTAGLQDIFIKTNFNLTQKTGLLVHLHHFTSPTTIYTNEQMVDVASSNLGEELDLVLQAKLGKEILLHIGYSQFLGASSLELLKNKNNAGNYHSWAWAMISFKPTLFSN